MKKKYTMEEFSKALQKLNDHMQGAVISKAAMAGGFVIEAHAKINVADKFKPGVGNLAGTIQTTLESSSPTRAEVAVGPTAVYGPIQEFGGVIKPVTAVRLHWVDEEGQHHTASAVTLPARPYMRPAVDENENAVLGAIGENLRIEIEGAI